MSRVADSRSLAELRRTLAWIGARARSWIFAPATAGELGWSRAAFFGFVLVLSFWFQRDFPLWSTVDEVYRQPMPLGRVLHLRASTEGALGVVLWAWRAALLLAAVGLASRPSAGAAALLGVYVLGLPQTFGKVNHNDGVVLLVIGLFALAPCGDGWSLDSLLRRARATARRAHGAGDGTVPLDGRDGRHGWPLQVLRLLVVGVLFSSAISKLQISGFRAWALSDNLSRLMLAHHYTGTPPTMFATLVASTPWLGPLLATGALSIEFLSPVLLLLRGGWQTAGAVAVASMMVGFWLGIGVLFLHLIMLLLLAFLPWRDIGKWLSGSRAPGLAFVACLALPVLATPAAAQRVRGTVVLPDSVTPAAGLIVVAGDAKGTAVASTLTGPRGEFELRLPRAGRFDLRVLRIGYKPTLVPGVEVHASDPRTIRIVTRGEAVILTAVRVRGESVCRIRQDSGQLVARLWEEARKAITATQLVAPGSPLVAQWITYDRATDLTGAVTLAERVRSGSGATDHPFVSLPPDSLARVGCVRTEGAEGVYTGPDADVLLSDSFADLHCFRVEPAPPDHPTWIGIGFRPARDRRDISDVEGTLWLERESAELRLIEYVYTNVAREYRAAKVGGAVEFLRLATGHWLLSRWAIRMPRATQHVARTFEGARNALVLTKRLTVEGLQIAGGEVREVSRDNVVLFTTGNTARDGLLAPIADNVGLATACGGVSPKDLALLTGSVSDNSGDPVAGATVSVNWNRDYINVGRSGYTYLREVREATTSGLGWWFVCDLPRATLLGVRAAVGERNSDLVLVKIPVRDSVSRVDLRLPPR